MLESLGPPRVSAARSRRFFRPGGYCHGWPPCVTEFQRNRPFFCSKIFQAEPQRGDKCHSIPPHSVKKAYLRRMPLESFLLPVEIYPVNFDSNKVKPRLVSRYAAASASEVRIENLIPRLCVFRKNPRIQRDWLFSWVKMIFILATQACMPKDFRVILETRPRIFALRHREVFWDIGFYPDQKAAARWQCEIIPTPDDLMF